MVSYRLLQEGKPEQQFTSAAAAGEAWHKALTRESSVMQYRQDDGQWRTMAAVGFDGNRSYKDMPFGERPGAAEFKAAYDEARFQFYTGSTEGKPAKEHVVDLSSTRQPQSGETYEGKFVARYDDKVIQAVSDGQSTFYVAHDRTNLSLRDQVTIKYGRDVSIQYHTLGHASVRDRQPNLERNKAVYQPKESVMDKKAKDQITYHLFEKGQEPQSFTDPKLAGAAWFKAEMREQSVMTVQKGEGPSRVYASVGKEGQQYYKDLPFDNMPGAADFKASFKDALELQKKEHAGAAAGKSAEGLAMSKPMDMPELRKAERGHTYEGKIVGFRENQVIQAVSDGKKTFHIAHERSALASAKAGLVHTGKDLSIKYPFAGIGIVQDRQLQNERKMPSHQPKGFGGRGM
ncbi:TPA: KfrB domain-containing protein [Pseudomonas aeruginosa]